MPQALTTAFTLLETSRSLGDAASAECSTAILLLTDGEITQGLGFNDPTEITDLVETLNADIQAQIFTFALGPEADSVSESMHPVDWRRPQGILEQTRVTIVPKGRTTISTSTQLL